MKKIIDTTYLSDPKPDLLEYLKGSSNNFVLLTHYPAIETYKGGRPIAEILADRFLILKDFPKQVLVLKHTPLIIAQDINRSDYRDRAIDVLRTNEFVAFCNEVYEAVNIGSLDIIEAFEKRQPDALKESEDGIKIARLAFSHIGQVFDEFTRQEINLMKKDIENIRPDLFEKIVRELLRLTFHYHKDYYEVDITESKLIDCINTIIFRFVTCYFMLSLRWKKGKAPEKPEDVRNHFYDCNIAGYGTLFDGMFCTDKTANATYDAARKFLTRAENTPIFHLIVPAKYFLNPW